MELKGEFTFSRLPFTPYSPNPEHVHPGIREMNQFFRKQLEI